ncbi:TerB family tellurite resistance protein [Franconibacter helveticus]|uniref:TerB family tellurite resistance protein n=1 Tax=Franconibacter helveticus TaxID=357240 RepID=UPI0037430CC9
MAARSLLSNTSSTYLSALARGGTREAEDVLDVAVAIAEADGEVEPEERKVLEEIANALGLRLENHL